MTRYGAPFGMRPTSNTFTTWSLSICDAATPSFTNRSTAPWSASTAGLMNFSATGSAPQDVRRLGHRAHPALAEQMLDAVLAVEHFARLGIRVDGAYWGCDIGRRRARTRTREG